MSQTSVVQDPPVAVRGHVVDIRPRNIESLISSNEVTATGDLDFGLGVVTDTALDSDDQVRTPVGVIATYVFRGVAIFDASKQSALPELAATQADYEPEEVVPVLTVGQIYVETDEAVTLGQAAFLRINGGNEGFFRTDVDAGDAIAAGRCTFAETTAGAGLAKLNVRL